RLPFLSDQQIANHRHSAETPGGFLIRARDHRGARLVIPKEHVESSAEIPDSWWGDFKNLFAEVPELNGTTTCRSMTAAKLAKPSNTGPRESGKPSSGKGFANLSSKLPTASFSRP